MMKKRKTIKEALQDLREGEWAFADFMKEVGDRQTQSIKKAYAKIGGTK